MLDGVYRNTEGEPVFREARAPSRDELAGLLEKIIARLLKMLTCQGYLVGEQGMTCPQCGGEFKIIAAIEEPAVIVRILTHLGLPARAPPRSPARPPALFQV